MDFNWPESVDNFLDNLASEHLTSTVSITEQPDNVGNHHNSYDISHPSTDAPTCVPSGKYLVNQGSQTDMCSLPSMREPIHTGTNTTPIFRKDKCQQFQMDHQDMNTSSHIKMVNCSQHLQGWDSPDTSPPLTPDLDIPRYYTNAYKVRMRALNLPEEECFQGLSFTINDEDPLPPHLSEEPVRWGQTPRPRSTSGSKPD